MEKSQNLILWWYHQQGLVHWPNPFPSQRTFESSSTSSRPTKKQALDQLYEEMRTFQGCILSQTAQHMVFAHGCSESEVLWVGEAPGAEEDRMGKPFVGPSGQLLDQMLASIGLHRDGVYITNVLPWRPPFNRKPSQEEVGACFPFLERHIGIIAPKLLVCVGGVATKALLQSNESLSQLQGKLLLYTSPYLSSPLPTFVLYHPAYLLRSPGQKKAAWHQLLCIKAFLCKLSNGNGSA